MYNFDVSEIINLFSENNLSELSLEHENFRLQIKKKYEEKTSKLKDEVIKEKKITKTDELIKIKSPQVGKIAVLNYLNKKEKNQRVNKGDVLCIIEAMKMMNEIVSPIDGILQQINVEEEAVVEYGEILFEIKPI